MQFQLVAWRNSARFLTASGVNLTHLRMLWFGRVRLRFPVSKLAGVAPKAQNTS